MNLPGTQDARGVPKPGPRGDGEEHDEAEPGERKALSPPILARRLCGGRGLRQDRRQALLAEQTAADWNRARETERATADFASTDLWLPCVKRAPARSRMNSVSLLLHAA